MIVSMPENNIKKPPTDFTIDCILSKSEETQNGDHHKSPAVNHPMNKVLDNPWISKFPLALTFNPSRRKSSSSSTSTSCSLYGSPLINFSDNLSPPTQHFTSPLNHFYPAANASTEDLHSDNSCSSLRKSFVIENSCDSESRRSSLSLIESFDLKIDVPSPLASSLNFKCSICDKTFDNSEVLDVSLKSDSD